MRIVLSAIDSKFIHSNLALRYLRKFAEVKNCNVSLHESTINDEVDQILAQLVASEPDAVVFSCYIWNISHVRQLISALRQLMPRCLILCGGPEVAYDAVHFLEESEADLVMAAEGEVVFPAILDGLIDAAGRGELRQAMVAFEMIPGLYLKTTAGILWTGAAPLANMELVPFPYDAMELERLQHRIIYYEGQRGCPFDCSYCLSSIDRTIRHKPLAMVKQELGTLMAARVPLVKFVDRTFNIHEDWAHDVLQFILAESGSEGFATSFHFEIGAARLSDRIIELLRTAPAGLFQIEAGIQSTDPEVLRQIHRRDDPAQLSRALGRILEGKAVHVHTDLIAGLPGDTLASFRNSFNDCIRMRPQMLQVGFLKVLKGTPLERQKDLLGIKHRDWPPYEVLQTGQMSYADLQLIKGVEAVTDKYYNSGKFPCTMKYLLTIYEEPWELFTFMAEYLLKYHYAGSPRGFEYYYRTVWEMWSDQRAKKACYLAEMLRFDFILSNRKTPIPDWLRNNKYNSSRGRLAIGGNDNLQLKGNVAGFKINMLRFWQSGEISVENSLLFYSLATPDLIPVKHRSGNDYELA